MQGKAKLLGHPIHQMLIVFPLGLLATSLVFDIVRLATGNPFWAQISYYMLLSGLIGGGLAAITGVIDFLSIPKYTRARTIGIVHGLGNVGVMTLFLVSFIMRNNGEHGGVPIGLSVIAALGALVTGWLGGELVDRLGVGVDVGAHLDSPSSLSNRPATDSVRDRATVRS